VPDLGSAASAAGMNAAVDHQAAANAASDGDIEHGIRSASRAEPRFRERRRVGVISQTGRQAQRLLAPFAERKILPAVDLMTLDRAPSSDIDRTAESNAYAAQGVARGELIRGGGDLLTNASGPARGIDGQSL
jgi:hypothetical protein